MTVPVSLAEFFNTMQEEPWFGGAAVDEFSVDSMGGNMIDYAIIYGNTEIIKHLIEVGVNVNQPGEWGDTPLHTAISFEKYDLACYLLTIGADGNKQNDYGLSAFELLKHKIFTRSDYDAK